MRCRQGQATRKKRLKFVTLNIYCFYTFKTFANAKEEMRQNRPLQNHNIVSRDLSRLRTGCAIMFCRKELVNAFMRNGSAFVLCL